ncbi:MAG TPA: hypothetical protein VK843_20490, partial [Planctomycetota bacterium]|nr:hypothetical protein [Planctomycetota bacterium]
MTKDPSVRDLRSAKQPKGERGQKLITHAELDKRLDALAVDPDSFAAGCLKLAIELDGTGTGLEITDPLTWRKPANPEKAGTRVTLAQQFRSEVDAMIILAREPEARLARRIEFARIRFENALKVAGLSAAEVIEG